MRRKRRQGRLRQQSQWFSDGFRTVARFYFGTVLLTIILALATQGSAGSLAFLAYAHSAPFLFWPILLILTLPALLGGVLLLNDLIEKLRSHDRFWKRYLKAIIGSKEKKGVYAVIPLVVDPEKKHDLSDIVFQSLILQDDANAGQMQVPVPCGDVMQLLGRERVPTRTHVIFGDPGGGKTTLLRHSVLLAARNADESLSAKDAPVSEAEQTVFLPVYIAMRHFAPLLVENPATAIRKYLQLYDEAVSAIPAFADHLQRMIVDPDQGEIWLFLDGMDEIDPKYHPKVYRWIADLKLNPAAALFIGTRRSGYQRELLAARQPAEWVAQPMSEPDQRELTIKLLPELYTDLHPQDPPLTKEQVEEEVQKFFAALDRHPHGTSWRGNPLLLSLVIFVFLQDGSVLPSSRVALYARSTDMLLIKTLTQEQGLVDDANPESILSNIRRVLGTVALDFFGVESFTEKSLDRTQEQLRRENLPGVSDLRIRQWVIRSRLVSPSRDGKSFAFLHHTFQEYLAAATLAYRLATGDAAGVQETRQFIRDHRFQDIWTQPMRMLAGALIATEIPHSREEARGWLRELMQIARSGNDFHDHALELAVASLADIPDVETFGIEVDAEGMVQMWVEALLRTARTKDAQFLGRFQHLAADLPRTFARPAMERLVTALKNASEPAMQIASARALAGMRDLVETAPLVSVLKEEGDRDVRVEAAKALVELEYTGRAHPGHAILLEMLEHADVARAAIIAEALGATAETGRDLILVALRHPAATVRRYAVEAMAGLGQRMPVQELYRALDDPDQEVAGAAIQVLARVGGMREDLLRDLAPDRFAALVQKLAEPVRSDIARSVLTEWGRGTRRPQAQELARTLTAQPDASWLLWQARARLEDNFMEIMAALGAMAQHGAEVAEVERTWHALLPSRLRDLGFTGAWRSGVAVILPPVVTVPAGAFLMGSDKKKDSQAYDDEFPQSSVMVGEFQIGTYPVTVAEYATAVRAGVLDAPPDDFGLKWQQMCQQRPDHPVVHVSWLDMMAYCRWLAQVTGQSWRLPTEAEWEKAARGTDGRIYPWGNQWEKARANTGDGGPGTTTPVGVYASKGDASPYGCHDMAGNVWEWTSSTYKSYPYDKMKCENDSDSTSSRALRGGSWVNDSQVSRAASRGRDNPNFHPHRGRSAALGACGLTQLGQMFAFFSSFFLKLS